MTSKYIIYNILLRSTALLLGPFLLLNVLFRRKHREGFWQKAGFYRKPNRGKSIWFHAVSVGEVIAAVPLVKKTAELYPDYNIVVSTVTPTGNRIARKMLPDVKDILYFPFDFKFSVRRAVIAIKPALCLILETELWPNFIRELYLREVPVVIVNGRVSSRSFHRYMFFSGFMKCLFEQITVLGMQSDLDAERVISLGASPEKVVVSGNVKYDREIQNYSEDDILLIKSSNGFSADVPLLLAGSTHPGEEVIIINVYKKLLKTHPDLALLIAPRHTDKIAIVLKAITGAGFTPVRKTALNGRNICTSKKEVLVLDTIGELARVYWASDIVFVGGSLVPHGGQNVLEPACCRKPVLFGTYMDNFTEISRKMVEAKAGIRVQDEEDLFHQIERLLDNPEEMKTMGENGYNLVNKNRGAIEVCLQIIKRGLQVADKHSS